MYLCINIMVTQQRHAILPWYKLDMPTCYIRTGRCSISLLHLGFHLTLSNIRLYNEAGGVPKVAKFIRTRNNSTSLQVVQISSFHTTFFYSIVGYFETVCQLRLLARPWGIHNTTALWTVFYVRCLSRLVTRRTGSAPWRIAAWGGNGGRSLDSSENESAFHTNQVVIFTPPPPRGKEPRIETDHPKPGLFLPIIAL